MNFKFGGDINNLYTTEPEQVKETVQETTQQPTKEAFTITANGKSINITKILLIIIIIIFAYIVIKTYINTIEIKYMLTASHLTELRRFI